MKISELLERDPAKQPLINNGQARIVDEQSEKEIEELHGELSTFVCEGQFADGIHRIVNSFLKALGHTSQKGAWVSGFYGSGKSHLLKMLVHLWQNTEFPDGTTARSLVPSLPNDVNAVLRELDTAGKREGGLIAAAGTLPSGSSDSVRLTILGILLRAVDLPAQYPQARFTLWLHEMGYYDRVVSAVEGTGKDFRKELNNLYVSSPIASALLQCDADFGANAKEVRATLRQQFPDRVDISTEEFLRTFKEALTLRSVNGKLPCTLLVLDEVQQFIGDSEDRGTLVTEVAEAVSHQFDARVMIVAAGQSALTDVPRLQKLMDRFTIRIPLSDADVESVTRKVLLQKKPSAINQIKGTLASNSGEVSRQLQGTKIGERSDDDKVIVQDYPLLPVRRRFWEHCFRVLDAAGTQSQLRSQLRIIHDAVAKISDDNLGTIIPADDLYEALAAEMVSSGILLREINERIIELSRDGSDDGKFARRICGLVFLIGKLPRTAGADIGVRASRDHIADLLITDLTADNGKFRSRVEILINDLVSRGTLMQVGDEVRLQTREGSEWDSEFKKRQAKLRNDASAIQLKQDQFLYAEIDRIVKSLKIVQGDAKVPRSFTIHREDQAPAEERDSIVLWIRDGWSTSQKDVEAAARSMGAESPVIHVFIPKQSADDLRTRIIDATAAADTIDFKGVPSTDEGREARAAMESRKADAEDRRDRLVKDIVSNTKVYQGGGNEVLSLTPEAKLRDAADASMIRLFPNYRDADYSASAWEGVLKRARDGADQPFQHVKHTGPTEQHPVCQQVITAIGAGKQGSDLHRELKASPFGWPQDAIDAALIALHRLQHVSATLNNESVALGQLDQNRIKKAIFEVEKETLSVQERLALRKLYQSLGVQCKSGEEGARAPEFLEKVRDLAARAGGDAPFPEAPRPGWLHDLTRLSGSKQLREILNHNEELTRAIAEWSASANLAQERKPEWTVAQALSRHAETVAGADDARRELRSIYDDRLLLDSSDPCATVVRKLADLLRDSVRQSDETYAAAYQSAVSELESSDAWKRLDDHERSSVLRDISLEEPTTTEIATDQALIQALDRHSLEARANRAEALSGKVARAIETAAKLKEPKVRAISLAGATLTSADDVERWIGQQRTRLLEEVKSSPILVK